MIGAFILQAAAGLAEHPGSLRMQQIDPHGWTLSVIAVSVVFSALLILFLLYSLSGAVFTGKFKKRPGVMRRTPDAETAAAIAMALDLDSADGAVPAAISVALHLYLGESVHDIEPGYITIRRTDSPAWRNKALTLRKKVQKI